MAGKSDIPRIRLAHLPTAIEFLPQLSDTLQGQKLFIKRDDQTGLALGGNKIRKLEFLIADALAQGAQTLITGGAVQSNHCRQTAAAAVRFKLACILVLTGERPALSSGNLLLDEILGADIIWTDQAGREQVLQQTFEREKEKGHRPYLIPYGGSTPIGCIAYIYAIQELMRQVKSTGSLPLPDWIIFPTSSGGTQAGMVLGARLYGYSGKILGISVDKDAVFMKEKIAALAQSTAKLLGKEMKFHPEDIIVNDDYLGSGYGVMGKPEEEAIRLFARTEGIFLDPVYTGRAAAGMVDLVRLGHILKDQTILFWHTGGIPSLFADKYKQLASHESSLQPGRLQGGRNSVD